MVGHKTSSPNDHSVRCTLVPKIAPHHRSEFTVERRGPREGPNDHMERDSWVGICGLGESVRLREFTIRPRWSHGARWYTAFEEEPPRTSLAGQARRRCSTAAGPISGGRVRQLHHGTLPRPRRDRDYGGLGVLPPTAPPTSPSHLLHYPHAPTQSAPTPRDYLLPRTNLVLGFPWVRPTLFPSSN
jgi:hypothetical protein